ncbi:DUF5412 domain-containing protein [Paenibacillus sp. YAF4_2]|uniref:DUF5412 domain-containing protein n=1 Tax=Paenibacillus sp. YAF4_2 TaxID=3233085 RepID=UPI003F945A3E
MDYFNEEVETEIRRTKKKVLIFFVSIAVLIIGVIGYGVNLAFFQKDRLPTGKFITQSGSPDGRYTIKAYVTNGGATTDFAVRAELITNTSSKRAKNIYWNYHEQNANIKWIDDDTVEINRHVLNLPHDKFDFRNQ